MNDHFVKNTETLRIKQENVSPIIEDTKVYTDPNESKFRFHPNIHRKRANASEANELSQLEQKLLWRSGVIF